MLLSALVLVTACNDLEDVQYGAHHMTVEQGGVLILCEGNYNSGNASLSYYDPTTKNVENGVFRRVNDRKLGDTGQSILLHDGTAYIAVENSGIVWGIDATTLQVKGQLTATTDTKIINPRYVHMVSDSKAYVTDLYAHYINIFNPKTYQYTGNIAVEEAASNGYCSTEEMVQYGKYVFVCCWSYSNKLLVIDTEQDKLDGTITLTSYQPKSMKIDKNGKIWVITDGGYESSDGSFGDNVPHLYRIDAASRTIELDKALASDEGNVQIALNGSADILYIVNNDIYRMSVDDDELPERPFISAPLNNDGSRHKLYGIGVSPYTGEIYVADAIDYAQAGAVYRYSADGSPIDQFKVGIIPNHFAFTGTATSGDIPDYEEDEAEKEELLAHSLVNKVYEYMPAPGHQVNGYNIVGDFIHDGATMEEACEAALSHFQKRWMVSLGGQGGYIVAGFDHNVTNSQGGYDIVIKGNPYSYQNEPGIIWVMKDDNGNGLPDDTWYELKGSEYGTANETLNYAITYYKPTAAKQDIQWTDNQGGSGIIPYAEAWNSHDSYWQDWVPVQTDSEGREYRTYYGSRLKDTHTYANGATNEPPFAWGYADNDGSDYFINREFKLVDGALGYYKISNAVDADGNAVNLPYINFVKVQTAQTGYSPNLFEISTEVYGIWDYHYNPDNAGGGK